MIVIEQPARQIMIQDGLDTFPDECCGFFYGKEESDGTRFITDILVVNNAKNGDKQKRFEISPQDYLRAEKFAEEKDLDFLGIYHSHPNHPAIPSEHDRIAAQPYFSYIIISVLSNNTTHMRSWRLNESFQFEEEDINNSILQNK